MLVYVTSRTFFVYLDFHVSTLPGQEQSLPATARVDGVSHLRSSNTFALIVSDTIYLEMEADHEIKLDSR